MSDTPTPPATAHDDPSPDHRLRTRYEHSCGQTIWVVELPGGPLYFAELLPTLPPPITHCPRCSEPVTRETLSQRERRPGGVGHA